MRSHRLLFTVGAVALMTASLTASPSPTEAANFPFVDVSRSWQIEPVDWLWNEGITTGVAPTFFAPERGVTRGEMAALLWRAAGKPSEDRPHPFDDVVKVWQEEAVRWLAANAITTGVSPTEFAPDREVTRGEMAAFLWRAEGAPSEGQPHPFVDVEVEWQREAIRWLYNAGITSGVTNTHFAPGRVVTRGEMAAFLHRQSVRGARLSNPPVLAPLSLLVFTETEGFRHSSIAEGETAIRAIAGEQGWAVEIAPDSARFLDDDLVDFDAVVFLQTTGDFFDTLEEAAFEAYIRGGGGFVGIHAAADAEYDWEWYGGLLGAWFDRHPAPQPGTIITETRDHSSTLHLGDTWERADEWYDFQSNPRNAVTVLLSLDEDSYSGGGMGDDHPIAWYHEYDGGRSWYTGLGHTGSSFEEVEMRLHLKGGIEWASGRSS